MEVSGVVFRPIQSFSSTRFFTQSSQLHFSGCSGDFGKRFSCEIGVNNAIDSKISLRSGDSSGVLSSRFSDNGHSQYYVPPRSGVKKEKSSKTVTLKKKLKFIKGLSKSLAMFPEIGFEKIGDYQGEDDERKTISEVTEVLMAQLQQLREEEKAIKKKKKKEEAKVKAAGKKAGKQYASSSSSESSDSDCEEVINMKHLKNKPLTHFTVNEPQVANEREASLTGPNPLMNDQNLLEKIEDSSILNSEESSSNRSLMAEASLTSPSPLMKEQKPLEKIEDLSILNSEESSSCRSCVGGGRCLMAEVSLTSPSPLMKDQNPLEKIEDLSILNSVMEESFSGKIEVCMGGKCRKQGGDALMEEFERRVGVNGDVVGCKCMGKCRNGPNVRVRNSNHRDLTGETSGFIEPQTNPLYIGVGLEDVGTILANLGCFIDDKKKNLALMVA